MSEEDVEAVNAAKAILAHLGDLQRLIAAANETYVEVAVMLRIMATGAGQENVAPEVIEIGRSIGSIEVAIDRLQQKEHERIRRYSRGGL